MDKKVILIPMVTLAIGILLGALITSPSPSILGLYGNIGLDLETHSIHMRIRVWKETQLILDEFHSGVVTDIGDNMTLFWIFGDTDMQIGSSAYKTNATYISIGNDTGTLASTSTQLPNEWHREAGAIEDEVQSQLNMTCTISGGDIPGGSQTADCIGINWASSGDNNLWAYDTFTQVTGIDDTFTINVEFQIGVSHS